MTTHGITKKYGDLEVLKGVDLKVRSGEVVSITGASGAGKTTLLQILGTLERPDTGEVTIGEHNTSTLSAKKLAEFRNKHIGFVFQFHHLLPEFTAVENVMMPGLIAGKNKKTCESRALELLSTLGLEPRAMHKPNQLSGGEQQRVAVARALFNKPDIILADEPSGNLDSTNAKQLHELFFKLREELGQTFIIVTHNDQLAAMADRMLTMKDGTLIGG